MSHVKLSEQELTMIYYKGVAKDYTEKPNVETLKFQYKTVLASNILTYDSFHFFMSEFARRNDIFTNLKLNGLSKLFFDGSLICKNQSLKIIENNQSAEIRNELCAFCYFLTKDCEYLNLIVDLPNLQNLDDHGDWVLIMNVLNEIQ